MQANPYLPIRKVAVIGAGVMGAAIAAHIANAGIPVRLLDIVPDGAEDRNMLAKGGIERALKARPAAFMSKKNAALITPGNIEDDLKSIKDCDWVIEAVLEKLEVKQDLWAKVEKVAKKTAIISSNSSGIPMQMQLEGRSEDFAARFIGAHWFNPPRYLHLLELIPTPATKPEVTEALSEFGRTVLGKGIVVANDVPGFVANRIGVYGIVRAMRHMDEAGLTPAQVDAITGPVAGRAKSATFRTADLSGLDIISHVAADLGKYSGDDENFDLPEYFHDMVGRGILGDKSGSGFFKKTKDENGKTKILGLDLQTGEYTAEGKVRSKLAESIKMKSLPERLEALYTAEGPEGDFMRASLNDSFWYAAKMAGYVSDSLADIDNAMKWGFGWEVGPFETMDILGVQRVIAGIEAAGMALPPLLQSMKDSGAEKFYGEGEIATPSGEKTAYEAPYLILADLKKDEAKVMKKRAGASLLDIGDGVLLVEWHAKMNALGEDQLRMIQEGHKQVQALGYKGLVIANQGEHFSAGANLPQILSLAQDDDWDELEDVIKQFQDTVTSLRYSPHPCVVAPHSMALGGGCEFTLYGDVDTPSAELYMGLVEVGVGLIPAGGGTAEMLTRFTDQLQGDQPLLPAVQRAFELIGTAKVSTSAQEARELGLLRDSDIIVMNPHLRIEEAKRQVLALAPNYVQPTMRDDIPVMGEDAVAAVKSAVYGMRQAGYITEYDVTVSEQLARILSGGVGRNRGMKVSTQHLLDLEREAFITLAGNKGTQQRIGHMLKTGKPLRN